MKVTMTKKIIATILAGLMLCVAFTGCEKKRDSVICGALETNSVENEALKYFEENNAAFSNNSYPENIEFKYFPSLNSMLLELNAGNIDYFGTSYSTAVYQAARDSSLSYVEDELSVNYHMATRPEDGALCKELSETIEYLKEKGRIDKLIEEHITVADPVTNTLAVNPDGETYVVGVTGDLPPMDYVAADGDPDGFNVSLLNAISEKTGCNFEIVQVDANARLTALASKKIDIIFWNGCYDTDGFESTNKDILLTTSYFNDNYCFVTKDYPIEKIKEIYGYK